MNVSKIALMHLRTFCVLILIFSGCTSSLQEKVRIAVAANSQFAVEEVAKSFEQNTGIDCETVVGSSGKLTALIQAGAPYDIFISANNKYPMTLYDMGLAPMPPKVYALGKLVLWSSSSEIDLAMSELTSDHMKKIAIANPKTAPYGTAAVQALNYYGLMEKLEEQLIFGESVSQVNQFVSTGAVEVGFTAKSIVLSPKLRSVGSWVEVDAASYETIFQSAILLRSEDSDAEKFYNYLFSSAAQSIFEKYGYAIPKSD